MKDSGAGIRESQRIKLFRPFETGGEQGEEKGLGLYISKMILDQLGGDIIIESRINFGTKCTFSIPVTEKISENEKAVSTTRSVD